MSEKVMRGAAATAGVALLAAGVAGAAFGWSTAALIAILASGLAGLLLGIAGHRLTGVEFSHDVEGGISVGLALSPELVETLENTGFDGLAASYAFVDHQLADDPASHRVKVRLQDALVGQAQHMALGTSVTEETIDRALAGGNAERVLAFGVLRGAPRFATTERILQGISQSQSGNEQYQALRVAEVRMAALTVAERDRILAAIDTAPYLPDDADRARIVGKIRRKYGRRPEVTRG